MDTIAARAAEGAALLDANLPGWAARIDPGRLNAASHTDSVLAQLRDQPVSVAGLCAVLVVNQTAHGFALDPDTPASDTTTGSEDTDSETDTPDDAEDADREADTPDGAEELTGQELTAAWHAEITRRAAGTLTLVGDGEGVG